MGNFEKLSVLVIVVIIVMILVVALYTWTDKPKDAQEELASDTEAAVVPPGGRVEPPLSDDEGWPDRLLPLEDEKDDVEDQPTFDPPPAPDPAPPIEEDPVEPDPAPEADGGNWEYTIKDGDTISQICERELGSWRRQKEVMALNPGLDPLTIRAGQVIKMPTRKMVSATPSLTRPEGPGGSSIKVIPGVLGKITPGEWYVVRRGDRLSTIAKRAYGSIERWPELWARNLSVVSDPDALEEGVKIYIPR